MTRRRRTTVSDVLHPRPQFAREHWTDLCGEWQFAYDDHDVGRQERWYQRDDPFPLSIQVPFPPESQASGIGDTSFHPVVWYRRTVDTSLEPQQRLLLHFGAVDYRAEVWVNGQFVVRHEGGHTPFAADITEALVAEAAQVIVVRAEDLPQDEAQPRGKQDVLPRPHEIWYDRTTGIWQPVWLEPVLPERIERVRWQTDVHAGTLRAQIGFHDVSPGSRLRLHLTLRGETVAEDSYVITSTAARDGLTRDLTLPQTLTDLHNDEWLWAPEHPHLFNATLTLTSPDGATLDTVQSYVGFRSVGASRGRFMLNGKPYYLRLVLEQGYWPESHLAAPSVEALRRDVELVKELGFNGVRVHQKVADPRFLYWCDRLGVAVWQELPAAYLWSGRAILRTTREWLEVLERDVSVPSIVAWVPVNESWGVPSLQFDPNQRAFVEALYALAKAYDGSRPVVGNDGWEHVVTDMVTVHDYSHDGETLRARYGSTDAVERVLEQVQPGYRPVLLEGLALEEKPLLLTEFGGISYQAGADFWNGYGAVADEEEFLERYRDLLDAVLASPVLAGFCYTQLTDTGQERNGLLTGDRQPKIDVAVMRSITDRPSAAVPADEIAGHAYGEHATRPRLRSLPPALIQEPPPLANERFTASPGGGP
jgi:beta-galactosidase/beta-glucuronidase